MSLLRAWRVCAAALALLALLCGGPQAMARTEQDFLDPELAFVVGAAMPDPATVEIRFKVAPGYYLYRERMAFEAEPAGAASLGPAAFPDGESKYDPTFEKQMEVYHHDMAVRLPVAPGAGAFTLKVTSQGCADAGICYPPAEHRFALTPVAGGYALSTAAPQAGAPQSATSVFAKLFQAGDLDLAGALGGLGWLRTAGLFLVLGVLLAFTPCVLPMVPILSSIIVGDRSGGKISRWRGFGLAAAYVAGMSVVYTALGVAAGLSGAGLAAWLQTPWVLALFAALLAVLALAMFDVFTLQLPSAMQARLTAKSAAIPGGRYTGAVVMGALSALIVGPCVAAPLAGALLYISQTGDVALGAAALFALAWGMGVPLLLVGASAGALLPRTGAWMEGVKRLFGLLLLAISLWMLIPVLPGWLSMTAWAFLGLLAAACLRTFEPLPRPARAAALFGKALGWLLAIASVAMMLGVASGGRDPFQPLAHLAGRSAALPQADVLAGASARQAFAPVRSTQELSALLAAAKRPVILDFYADWCVSCHEMERFTFGDPAVMARLARMDRLRADVTANNPDDRALLKRFRLFGPPGIIFFAPGGAELSEARVVGFKNAAEFAAVLDRALASAR
jgi:thiol:disulfide interchange protein DsbD